MHIEPLLIEACEVYLRTDSPHKHGFCAWATDYLCDQHPTYYWFDMYGFAVYHIVGSFLKTQVGGYGSYAAPQPGRHPLRTEFVQKLLNHLKGGKVCS